MFTNRAACGLALALASVSAVAGCGHASGEQLAQRRPAGATAPAPAEARAVARIVFIDLEEACDCDRRRAEATWAALQTALGDASGIAVERVHRDTQEDEAEPYVRLRPMMVVPGVYFLDEGGAVIEMLQGEVTPAQARAVLASGS